MSQNMRTMTPRITKMVHIIWNIKLKTQLQRQPSNPPPPPRRPGRYDDLVGGGIEGP